MSEPTTAAPEEQVPHFAWWMSAVSVVYKLGVQELSRSVNVVMKTTEPYLNAASLERLQLMAQAQVRNAKKISERAVIIDVVILNNSFIGRMTDAQFSEAVPSDDFAEDGEAVEPEGTSDTGASAGSAGVSANTDSEPGVSSPELGSAGTDEGAGSVVSTEQPADAAAAEGSAAVDETVPVSDVAGNDAGGCPLGDRPAGTTDGLGAGSAADVEQSPQADTVDADTGTIVNG